MNTTQKLPDYLYIKHHQGRKQDKGFYVVDLRINDWDSFESQLVYEEINIDDIQKILSNTFGIQKFRLYLTYPKGNTYQRDSRWDILN